MSRKSISNYVPELKIRTARGTKLEHATFQYDGVTIPVRWTKRPKISYYHHLTCNKYLKFSK